MSHDWYLCRTLLLEMMWAMAEADGGMKDEEMAALRHAHEVHGHNLNPNP